MGIRGSFGIFPLQIDDCVVSSNQDVNVLAVNGIFTLKEAYEEYFVDKFEKDEAKILQSGGFSSLAECKGAFYDQGFIPDSAFWNTTPKDPFLAKNPPNVVFVQMESLGSYYLMMDTVGCDMLNSLRYELPYCTVFPNTLSATNGTIFTLESFIISSIEGPVS